MKKTLLITLLMIPVLLISIISKAQNDTTTNKVLKNQYGLVVDHQILQPETWNGIISFRSKDDSYRMWFDNRVYIDGGYFFDKNTYNEIGNGVKVRRARFAIKAKLYKNWYGEIDLDFADSELEMKDMYIAYKFTLPKDGLFKNIAIKGGQFKETFSMEYTTTSRYLTFIERSLANTFVPSRTMGLQTQMNGNHFFIGAGVSFNQLGDSEVSTWSKDRNKDQGMDEGYSLTGRLVALPIVTNHSVLHLGVAGSYRTPKTSWEITDAYRYSTRSLSSVNRKKYLDTDDIRNVENLQSLGLELAGAWNNFMFQGEYIMQNVHGTDLNRTVGVNEASFDGAYFQAGWLIFGGKYQYNRREAEFTQININNKKGELELAARYDYISLNDVTAKIYGGGANAYTIGINYYANNNVKFMLNYSYADHDRYANGKGKLVIGNDDAGEPTKDWSAVNTSNGTPGEQFGFIQFRAEIDF